MLEDEETREILEENNLLSQADYDRIVEEIDSEISKIQEERGEELYRVLCQKTLTEDQKIRILEPYNRFIDNIRNVA